MTHAAERWAGQRSVHRSAVKQETLPRVRASRNEEDGQVVTALIVLVFGLILLVTVIGLVPLGQATDEASQASNAADAAALGAAKMIRDTLLDELLHASLRYEDLDRDGLGRGPGCSMGRSGADDYAGRNAARVVSYCYDRRDSRVEVDVQLSTQA